MGSRRRIGVCLSGGGFRASFFALGILRYLAEAGCLADVVGISAVSGGSIAAAALADKAGLLRAEGSSEAVFLREVYEPFRSVVTNRNLRNEWLRRAVAARLKGRRVGRGVVLGELLQDRLYRTDTVGNLPPGHQVILTTTDLATGRAFRICRDFVGSYDFGYVAPPRTMSVGFAAAASAAVPALFPPASLATEGLGLTNAPSVLSLSDGGVYDNLGLEWFQGWASGRPSAAKAADFLVVANAGGQLSPTSHPYGGLRGMWRAKDVQYSQTTKVRVRWYVGDLIRHRQRGIYLAVELDPRMFRLPDGTAIDSVLYDGALPSSLIGPLAMLRTDLDRFEIDEADLLAYHGYWSTHARLGALYKDLAVSSPSWRQFSDLGKSEIVRLRKLLDRGSSRRIR
jgi:NTE family protein